MQSRLLLFTALLLLGCNEQVIRLDVAGEDAGDLCPGEVNDAGKCIVRSRNTDGYDSDHNRDDRGECERIEEVLASCIENLGADDSWCIRLQERLDTCWAL